MGRDGKESGILKNKTQGEPSTLGAISTQRRVSFSDHPKEQRATHDLPDSVERIFDNLKVLIESKPWEIQKGDPDQKNADQATLYAARFAGLQHLGKANFTIDPKGHISHFSPDELAILYDKCKDHKAGLDRALWQKITTLIQGEIAWRQVAEQVGGESFRSNPEEFISKLSSEQLETLKIKCQDNRGQPDGEQWQKVGALVHEELSQREVIARQARKQQKQYNEGREKLDKRRTSADKGESRSRLAPMKPLQSFSEDEEDEDMRPPAINPAKQKSIRGSHSPTIGSISEAADDDNTPPSPTAGRLRK